MGHLSTVQSIYEAFGRGDIPAILERLHPDVEWEHDSADHGVPWLAPRRGREAVLQFFEALQALEITRFEPLGFLAGQDQVAGTVRLHATHRVTGKEIRDLELHLFSFDAQGRVSRFRHFVDTFQHHAVTRA